MKKKIGILLLCLSQNAVASLQHTNGTAKKLEAAKAEVERLESINASARSLEAAKRTVRLLEKANAKNTAPTAVPAAVPAAQHKPVVAAGGPAATATSVPATSVPATSVPATAGAAAVPAAQHKPVVAAASVPATAASGAEPLFSKMAMTPKREDMMRVIKACKQIGTDEHASFTRKIKYSIENNRQNDDIKFSQDAYKRSQKGAHTAQEPEIQERHKSFMLFLDFVLDEFRKAIAEKEEKDKHSLAMKAHKEEVAHEIDLWDESKIDGYVDTIKRHKALMLSAPLKPRVIQFCTAQIDRFKALMEEHKDRFVNKHKMTAAAVELDYLDEGAFLRLNKHTQKTYLKLEILAKFMCLMHSFQEETGDDAGSRFEAILFRYEQKNHDLTEIRLMCTVDKSAYVVPLMVIHNSFLSKEEIQEFCDTIISVDSAFKEINEGQVSNIRSNHPNFLVHFPDLMEQFGLSPCTELDLLHVPKVHQEILGWRDKAYDYFSLARYCALFFNTYSNALITHAR